MMVKSASIWKKIPYFPRVLMYYLSLFFLYRYLVHGYLEEILSRQLLGARDTFLATLTALAYLLMVAIPPWLWSRSSLGRRVSRGLETFACYALVFLGTGFLCSLDEGGSWKPWYGLTASGGTGVRVFSLAVLLATFLTASLWGGSSRGKKRSRASRRPRRTARKGRK
ncbi:MAG: hypothetical protein ACUVSI_01590 [Actinomycetota bacterium]